MLHQAPPSDKKNKQKFRKAAQTIWKNYSDTFLRTQATNGKLIITISGGSGSGKSSIAYYLCKLFIEAQTNMETNSIIRKAKHLWSDDFYLENYKLMDPIERNLRRAEQKYQNIGPQEYDWKEIEAILKAFRNGSKCRMPCVDLLNQQIDWLETDFKEVNTLVIEGLYAIDMNKNTLKVDHKFFIDSGLNDVKQGNTDQEKDTVMRKKVLEEEKKALDTIKNNGIKQKDLILLKYDEQETIWKFLTNYQNSI